MGSVGGEYSCEGAIDDYGPSTSVNAVDVTNATNTIDSSSQHRLFYTSDMLIEISLHLSPRELFRFGEVSRTFLSASRSDLVWERQCGILWSSRKLVPSVSTSPCGKVSRPTSLFPFGLLSPRCPNVKVKELKTMVRSRPNPSRDLGELARCVEKGEMRGMVNESCMGSLLDVLSRKLVGRGAALGDGGKPVAEAMSERPLDFLFAEKKWFGSYLMSCLDLRRTSIAEREFVDRALTFYFKQGRTALDYRQRRENLRFFAECTFGSTGEFVVDHENHYAQHPGGLRWVWRDEGDERGGHNKIQVLPYPEMTISRMGDGGWLFENVHVQLFLS